MLDFLASSQRQSQHNPSQPWRLRSHRFDPWSTSSSFRICSSYITEVPTILARSWGSINKGQSESSGQNYASCWIGGDASFPVASVTVTRDPQADRAAGCPLPGSAPVKHVTAHPWGEKLTITICMLRRSSWASFSVRSSLMFKTRHNSLWNPGRPAFCSVRSLGSISGAVPSNLNARLRAQVRGLKLLEIFISWL